MALSDPRIVYGLHSFSPYSRSTGEFFGTAKVVGDSSLSLAGELVSLNGGSFKFPWAIEDGNISAEMSLKFKQYEDFLFEVFLGKAPTANSAESGGSVTTLANKNGTSVVDSSTGIASVGVKSGSEADVKFAAFIVKAVSATTVDVFASTDVDFARGTDKEFENDLLKITASALTITTSTAVEVPGFGVELTGGSGTIGMTSDDTATFESRPINDKSMDVRIGGTTDVFPEFGAYVYSQKRGNGEILEIDVFRAKAIGLPIGFAEKAFAEPEVTAQAFYDSTLNGVFDVRHVTPSSA